MAKNDESYMQLALAQARQAGVLGEVPVGAVVVCSGEVVAKGFNRRESDHDPTAHAELIAIRSAAVALGRWRLADCTIYVTLEPCPMCAGAMHQARIARCVYGADDPKAGALGTLYDLHDDERLNHRFAVARGCLEQESAVLLREFFGHLRGAGKSAERGAEK
ncbi:MAG: tRNA adenosine(34) deaminase TadA [Coriobacteriia bacterium]|nr:tRNA adenosine(34) deaminase TadA [Coriobacteriia bacterium]